MRPLTFNVNDRVLGEAVELSGDNQTHTINKALKLYTNHLRNEADGGHTEQILPDGTRVRWLIL